MSEAQFTLDPAVVKRVRERVESCGCAMREAFGGTWCDGCRDDRALLAIAEPAPDLYAAACDGADALNGLIAWMREHHPEAARNIPKSLAALDSLFAALARARGEGK